MIRCPNFLLNGDFAFWQHSIRQVRFDPGYAIVLYILVLAGDENTLTPVAMFTPNVNTQFFHAAGAEADCYSIHGVFSGSSHQAMTSHVSFARLSAENEPVGISFHTFLGPNGNIKSLPKCAEPLRLQRHNIKPFGLY